MWVKINIRLLSVCAYQVESFAWPTSNYSWKCRYFHHLSQNRKVFALWWIKSYSSKNNETKRELTLITSRTNNLIDFTGTIAVYYRFTIHHNFYKLIIEQISTIKNQKGKFKFGLEGRLVDNREYMWNLWRIVPVTR